MAKCPYTVLPSQKSLLQSDPGKIFLGRGGMVILTGLSSFLPFRFDFSILPFAISISGLGLTVGF